MSKEMADLYIIHGWTYIVEPWAKTLEILKANGLKVKMLHVPGLTEPSDKVYTIEDYEEWADQQIPDGAIALGHSNGGRILLNLCSKKPEKLSYLILLDSAGVYEPSKKKKIVAKIAKIGRPLGKIKLLNKIFHRITGIILWGKKDTTTPPRQATKIYEKLPNADLKFYANWTHAPYISNPEELARVITKLILRIKK